MTTIGTAAVLAVLVLAAGPVSAASVANGVATATYAFCPQDSDVVVLRGTSAGGIWTFSYSLASGCDGYNSQGSATGAWDPNVGGCLGSFCLTAPDASEPGVITYTYSNALEAHSGTARLAVA